MSEEPTGRASVRGPLGYLVLGPVRVYRDGQPVALAAAMQRAVLAVLVSQAGRAVSADYLIEALWEGSPPPTARKTLQVYVRRLRQALDCDDLRRDPAGYLLAAGPRQVDAARFDALVEEGLAARRRGALEQAAARLEAGLGLWRGEPYADVRLGALADEVRRLGEQRLLAQEEYAEVRLDLGRPGSLGPELDALCAANPFRERLTACRMLALCRTGRRLEALEVYQRTAALLDDEMGVRPGPVLGWLREAIARDDPAIAHLHTDDLDRIRSGGLAVRSPSARSAPVVGSPAVVPAALAGASVPRQLPADATRFTGRRRALKELDSAAAAGGDTAAGVVIVISGTAGVGKTALAVRWAHRVAERFGDGQLYVNLRGFDPTGALLRPDEVIRRFLDALEVPRARLPADPDAQVALYRTVLARRRMLIVLDNARDVSQVRPLLPGAAHCLVVVTSRHQLASLVATEGARPVPLDLLSPDEAHRLLTRRLGAERTQTEPQAVREIVARCAGLPLALAIVAARAAVHPNLPLRAFAEELGDSRDSLDALVADEDPTSDVRAVLSWSYRAVSPASARLFRLLGRYPGPDISVPAAASLAALPARRVRPLLGELRRANLITQHVPGRYAFHDLLRAYATDLTGTIDSDGDRRAATVRLLDHYLHTAHTAARLLDPARDPIPLPLTPPAAGTSPERLADLSRAIDWLGTERRTLLAAQQQAVRFGLDTHAWQLAWALVMFLYQQGYWHDSAAAWQTALAAAERLADPAAQARAHRLLAQAHTQLGHHARAHVDLERALDLYTRVGDRVGQANVHHSIAVLAERQDRLRDALGHAQQAFALYEASGNRHGAAIVCNNVGWLHARLSEYRRALFRCEQALALAEALGDRHLQAATSDSLGYIHHHRGEHAQAVGCYQRALDLYRDLGDRYLEADTLTHLGDTYLAAGDARAARAAWESALAILTDVEHPDADGVRARLDTLTRGPQVGVAAVEEVDEEGDSHAS